MPLKKPFLEVEPLWYKDAIIYELHVKAFCDSNDDGVGDFRGLISKLDYLQGLGITAIWLLPFYPSPLKDDGYDIADYYNIHPAYGTLHDFKEFLTQAHRRGIRVITELVINHTSDQHPWFQKSRRAKNNSIWRNFYVWSDTPKKYKDARIIFKDFETSNWTWDSVANAYYWHRFYSHQPDLNYDNPQVQERVMDVIDYWLGMGVDGLRLDAVPYLYEREGTNCENLPETHAFLKKLRAHVDKTFKNRMLLAEANQWPEDAIAYLGDGDECHMAFNFPVMPRMFMAIQMEDRFPIVDIFDPGLDIPETCQWALFLRNHDELTLEMVTDEERDYMYRVYAQDPRAKINLGIRRRLAPLLSNNRRRIELMNFLLFSLPGSPAIYYGDEIGMGDNFYLGDRDGVRTPMQWSPDRNADFSKTNPQKLYLPVIIDPEYHYEVVNVENQERNLSSILWWMKRVISMRKKFKAFGRGSTHFLSSQNPKVLAFVRQYKDETILVVINLSRFAQVAELGLSQYAGYTPEDVFSQNKFPIIRRTSYVLTLGSHDHFWFLLQKEKETISIEKERVLPEFEMKTSLKEILTGESKRKLEQEVFVRYLKRSLWFSGRGRTIRKINITEISSIFKNSAPAYLLLLAVYYNEGIPETYLLPLFFATREKEHLLEQECPQGIIARIRCGEESGVLYDGVYNKDFNNMLIDLISKRKKLKGKKGEFIAHKGKKFKSLCGDKKFPLDSNVLRAEQSNTSIIYENTFILKLFRKLESGPNPDVEIIRFLTEKTHFSHIPPFAGAIEYRQYDGSPPVFVGLLQSFVPNLGDAWTYMLDTVGKYFERILSERDKLKGVSLTSRRLREEDTSKTSSVLKELVGEFFFGMVRLLGERTGEMHLSLASVTDDPDFAPEPFSTLYQRSVYQSMKSLLRRVFLLLERNIKEMNKEHQAEALEVLDLQDKILQRFAKILGRKISAMKIRIHGDYHLGQVLFTGKDFVIIDFEGESARALSERRLKRSPLRDVAGMVRSFHYAAHAGLLRCPLIRPEDTPFLKPWVDAWYHYVGSIFLHSYLNVVDGAAFLPDRQDDFDALFEAFLLEKAVYELGYELKNRPDWLVIPFYGIKYALKESFNDV